VPELRADFLFLIRGERNPGEMRDVFDVNGGHAQTL
jgi:hypothetical protein